jgi:transcription elongation factor Elf1
MTVTVIDAGPHQSVVKEVICKNCGATLQYTPNDVKRETVTDYGGGSDIIRTIQCPPCGQPVGVK